MADYTVTAANVALVSGNVQQGVAGAAITAGNILYIDTTDSNKLKLADCDSGTAIEQKVVGVALNDAASGQYIVYALDGAVVNMGATLAAGDIAILSGTAGAFAPSSDAASSDVIVILGVASTTANLNLNIYNSAVTKT